MTSTLQRNRVGTKSEEFNAWMDDLVSGRPLVSGDPRDNDSEAGTTKTQSELLLARTESSLAVQSVLQTLVRADPSALKSLSKLPSGVDSAVWQSEHLRLFVLELNQLVALLLQDNECSPANGAPECVEMKAGEWQYLCAAHPSPMPCSAIDYMIHTLDGATALLNSTKFFPSRVTIPSTSHKHFASLARRLYRVFAHAWFHHRAVFDAFENETCLYKRFLYLTTIEFELIPEKLITIPQVFDFAE
ncbi:Mob1/phocein [Chytriomyces sp. MP71]|nr:Mob1/phocein [Chytriomyces sp. MP71]